ncbi:hypothetical protein F5B21DRAFT_493790 [Xylaria acuta]|nr:hypothetical protein F5B21DRAFT_493790 [Xylaria acuta]
MCCRASWMVVVVVVVVAVVVCLVVGLGMRIGVKVVVRVYRELDYDVNGASLAVLVTVMTVCLVTAIHPSVAALPFLSTVHDCI